MTRSLRAGKEQPVYLSYLLRLWQVDADGAGNRCVRKIWRVSLESSLTGERMGFASLEELFEFLHQATGTNCDVDEQGS